MKTVKLGLLGLGTVGGGVAEIVADTITEIERRLGGKTTLKVVHIAVRDLNKPRVIDTSNIKLTTNPMDVLMMKR